MSILIVVAIAIVYATGTTAAVVKYEDYFGRNKKWGLLPTEELLVFLAAFTWPITVIPVTTAWALDHHKSRA
jgi:hypothetical protein